MSPRSMPTPRRRALAGLAAAAVFAGLPTVAVAATAPDGQSAAPLVAAATAPATPLVGADAPWRYLENDTFPSEGDADPLSWTKDTYDATAWKTGAGSFGGKISGSTQSADYSSSLKAAVQLEMNAPGSSNRVRTYFFRTSFDVTAAQKSDLAELRTTMRFDDGAVVYLNGTEIGRYDVAAGDEGLKYASGETTGLDSLPLTIKGADVRVGTNVLAVEVHNDRASSSDVWFDMADLVPLTAEEARPKPSRIILTPTDDPYTSQNITFQGAVATDTVGRVEIRPSAGGDLKSVKALRQADSINNPFGHFSATVTGLKPATAYTYRVSSNGNWSGWSEFETADRAETDFQYVYYGDAQIGLDSTWPKVVAQAEAQAPDSIGSVHAGDLIDTASNDGQWDNWFKGMARSAASTNVMAAPGNHEYSGDKLLTAWKAHFEYPLNNPNDSTIGELAQLARGDSESARHHRAYFDHWADFAQETVYFADYQGVRFITVNATRDTTFLRPDVVPSCTGGGCVTDVADLWVRYQAAWLDHVLETSESKWNVVTFHQPVYSTSSGRNEPVLREHWVPVFQKHDIDLVQMGHDHTYARGFNNADVTETPGLTDGPVYMVSNSGAKHYSLESDERNVWTLNGATQVKKGQYLTTYQVVDVSEGALRVRSYIAELGSSSSVKLFHNGEQVDASQFKVGDLWDEFTVHKTDDGRKAVVEAGMEAPEFEDLTPAPVVHTDLPGETPVVADERVELSVEVEGAQRLQWQVKPVGGEWSDLAGATSATLEVGRVLLDELGTAYRLVATAGTKVVTSGETVLVDGTAAPVITSDLPLETEVVPGERVQLAVVTEGAQSHQWQSRTAEGEWTDVPGARGATLSLGRVGTDEVGTAYRVVVTAVTQQVVSGATVLVDATRTPVLTTDLPGSVTVMSGGDVTLQVALDADTPADLQWQRNVNGEWLDLPGRTGATLVLESVRTGADYRVVATAGAHTTTSGTATVVVAKQAADVRVMKVKARAGKKAVVRVRSSVDGVAQVTLKRGTKVLRKVVVVTAERPVAVRLGTLPRKGTGKAVVTVVVTPNGLDHAPSKASKKVVVKK